jgi:hypothetical protein
VDKFDERDKPIEQRPGFPDTNVVTSAECLELVSLRAEIKALRESQPQWPTEEEICAAADRFSQHPSAFFQCVSWLKSRIEPKTQFKDMAEYADFALKADAAEITAKPAPEAAEGELEGDDAWALADQSFPLDISGCSRRWLVNAVAAQFRKSQSQCAELVEIVELTLHGLMTTDEDEIEEIKDKARNALARYRGKADDAEGKT